MARSERSECSKAQSRGVLNCIIEKIIMMSFAILNVHLAFGLLETDRETAGLRDDLEVVIHWDSKKGRQLGGPICFKNRLIVSISNVG